MRFSIGTLVLLCSACSLLNSTDDLRNMDAGMRPDIRDLDVPANPDSTPGDVGADVLLVDAGPDPDGGPADSGPADAGPEVDAGPPDCVYSMDIAQRHFPPVFHIAADGDDCPETATVQEPVSGFGTPEDDVDRIVTFDVDGAFFPFPHRVPIMDNDRDRHRTFMINGVAVEDVRMPVERMEVRPGGVFSAAEVQISGEPSVDIDNNGNVVFASSDDEELGAIGSNIFYWHIAAVDIDRPGRPSEGGDGFPVGPVDFRSPKLSDDGAMMAYIDTQDGINRVYYSRVGGEPTALTGVATSAELHLDLRSNESGEYQLLVHTDGGNDVFEWSEDDTPAEVGSGAVAGGPGLLDGLHGYSAQNTENQVFFLRGNVVITPGGMCTESDEGSLARTNDTETAFASDCGAGGRNLHIGESLPLTPTLPTGEWGLAGATDGLDLFLLRSGEGELSGGYALSDKDSNEAPLILNGLGVATNIVPRGFAGAAISPNGEWAVYATPMGSGTQMQVFRARTTTP